MKVYIANNAEALISIAPTHTVEAEFGSTVIGRILAAAKDKLDYESFVTEEFGVILRKSENFVNHLYRDAKAIVAFNTKTKAITLSLSEPIEGVNCAEIAKKLWGSEAGGHAGIAGSPRGREMAEFQATKVAAILAEEIHKAVNGYVDELPF